MSREAFILVDEVISKVKMEHWPSPIKLSTSMSSRILSDAIEITLSMSVTDVDTGFPTTVFNIQHISCNLILKARNPIMFVVSMLHKQILDAIRHEVDECFTYEGIRIFDPHKENKNATGI